MQHFVVLFVAVSLCAGHAIPSVPGNNSHYVEGVSRYIWMPDGEGIPHLVDLEEPVPKAALDERSGANNQYWLFTRRNRQVHQRIRYDDADSITNSNYNRNRPLMVIVHGWNSKGSSSLNPLITGRYLDVADANVIVVDWSRVASGTYSSSVRGVPDVGRHLGNFLMWLVRVGGGNWNNIHLVGFSLGAHVVGNAGRTTRREGRIVARITGLDPAGPQWDNNHNALHRNDGQYVEAIHTDGGVLGIFDPLANADFYPNGGINPQRGCTLSTCSHSRAYELFAASVAYNHHIARGCRNLVEVRDVSCRGAILNMGNSIVTKRGTPGLYGLATTAVWGFKAI